MLLLRETQNADGREDIRGNIFQTSMGGRERGLGLKGWRGTVEVS